MGTTSRTRPRAGAAPSAPGAAVAADGLRLSGPRGDVYRDVTFRAAPGALVALAGPSGSGRTCLLLTLTGRMRPSGGTAEAGGRPLPRRAAAVRRFAALGAVPGVNDLDPALTVGEHLRERLVLRRAPRRAGRRASDALAAAGLDVAALPRGERTRVDALGALDHFRLSLAAALLGGPRLLGADDVGDRLSAADRGTAWELLRSIADRGCTVLAACPDPEEAARHADVTVHLGRGAPADSDALDSGGRTSAHPSPDPGTEGADPSPGRAVPARRGAGPGPAAPAPSGATPGGPGSDTDQDRGPGHSTDGDHDRDPADTPGREAGPDAVRRTDRADRSAAPSPADPARRRAAADSGEPSDAHS